MSDNTIFETGDPPSQVTDPTKQPTFQIPTEAVEFIGSGKKYQSAEEALKSVPHAQKHIQTLEQELQQLKEELTKRKTAQELLDDLKSGISTENTPQSLEIDPDKIEQIVTQSITAREQQKLAETNTSTVVSKFTEKFGNEAEKVYNSVAKEAGLTIAQLNRLAASSPNAVLKLAGLDKPSTSSIPGKQTSSVNTQAFTEGDTNKDLSARVPKGASTKDLVNAWRIAGEKVKQNLSIS